MTPLASHRIQYDPDRLARRVFSGIISRADLLRDRESREEAAWESFGKPHRDPASFGGVLAGLARQDGWEPHLQMAHLRRDWEDVVGPAVALHTRVLGMEDGILTIRAESPVWATQLRFMTTQIRETIRRRLPEAGIRDVVVTGPLPRSGHRRW